MGHFILALSLGRVSSKAILVDHKGKIVSKAEYPLKQIRTKAGWIEYRPEDILKSQKIAITALFRKIGSKKKQIMAVGISSQPATIVIWNKTTGKPLCNAISSEDTRGSEICTEISEHKDTIRERTGLPLSPFFSASKIKWLLENIKTTKKLADKGQLLCGTVNTYLLWHLSNGNIFSTDHANAAQTLLFNIFTKSWDKELLEVFKIPYEILPSIVPNSVYMGEIALDGQAFPVHASTTERQAALIGNGCLQEGDVLINLDTAGYIQVNTGKKIFMLPGLSTSVAWSSDAGASYLLEAELSEIMTIFEWMKNNLGIFNPKEDLDSLCRLSKERLYTIPAIANISPQGNSTTTSSIFGMKSTSRREDIIRSIVESVGFIIKDNFNIMEKDERILLKKAKISGGMSLPSYLLQFQTDLLQIPLKLSMEEDPISKGCSYLAGLSVKMWPSLTSIEKLIPSKKPILPKQNEADVKVLYDRWKLTFHYSREWSRNF